MKYVVRKLIKFLNLIECAIKVNWKSLSPWEKITFILVLIY